MAALFTLYTWMLKRHVFPDFPPALQLQRTAAILNCINPTTTLPCKMASVVRESAGQRADTHRADEIGQVKFKLTLNVTAGWSFLSCHISDSDCSGLEFWFKHRCRLTIAACRRPAFRWSPVVSSVATSYPLDKWPELVSNH